MVSHNDSALTGVTLDALDLEDTTMLETIAIILLVLWLLGLVTSYAIGGFIHLLLVFAVVAILIRIINGRRPL